MLSEQVLDYLARNSPLQEQLTTVAWPSISTESKLQLIEAIQRSKAIDHWTPDWLMALAINDGAAVVRYWAAHHFHFKDGSGEDRPIFFGTKATDLDKALHAQAMADPEWLVKACVNNADLLLSPEAMSATQQSDRLAYLRHKSLLQLTPVITWLDKAVDEGVPDKELYQCAEEVFSHPQIQVELKRPELDYAEGSDAYYAGKGVIVGWEVVRKAGPRLRSFLSFYLPTSMGLGRIKPEELATMPTEVIRNFGFRSDCTGEIKKALELVCSSPEKFSEIVLKAAESAQQSRVKFNVRTVEKRSRQSAIDKSQATLDTVLALQEQLATLTAQFEELAAGSPKKRGFFG